MDSYLLYQTRCPICEKDGHDKQGDNLAVYNDGHKYCFRCGYNVRGNGFSSSNTQPTLIHDILLPVDADIFYPDKALKWIEKYHLTKQDLLKNNVLYSEKGFNFKKGKEFYTANDVLLFPIWASGLQGFQGRYFGDNKAIPKWISKGRLSEVFNILYGYDGRVTLVEDIVSAIKVHKAGFSAMPLYGNNAKNRFSRLSSLGYRKLVLWLDPDMKSEMVRQAKYAHGIELKLVFSEKDPKEYSLEQIKEYINE